jgi:hypothetical protein
VNREKYKGSWPVIFRSSWELWLKAFTYLDRNSKILTWGSESVVVQYTDPSRNNTIHRYFLDLIFTIKKNDRIETYIVEIKPHSQTQPPKRGKKSDKTFLTESTTWMRNAAKWKAAKEFADRRGWKFVIWTEKELKM